MEHYDWGLPLAIDLFAAGLGAAIFMVAVAANLAGGRRYRRISTTGAIIAPWPVILGVLFLVVDLGKPLRFWEMMLKRSHETLGIESIMFNAGSTMSLGTWLLILFVLGSLVYMVVAILAWPFKWAEKLQKVLGVIGLPIALLVTTYTGVLLSATRNSVWGSVLLPIVFVVSAIATGIAAIVFILAAIRVAKPDSKIGSDIPKLEVINGWTIAFQLLMVILFVIFGFGSAQMRAVIGSAFGLLWWIGVIGLGLVLPLVIGIRGGAKNAPVSLVVSALVLLGGFFLRYTILLGGQLQI